MGSPPPVDGPPLSQQQANAADAGFSAGPPINLLCGLKIPSFKFKLLPNLPAIEFPPELPKFLPSLGINCALLNPQDAAGGGAYGGGRIPTHDADPDDVLDSQT